MESNKLSKGLTGIAGEYYAAAELSIRNYMAAITLRNNDSVDILACRQSDLKTFSIQVKTINAKYTKWPLNKKAEDLKGDNLFYIFVHLRENNQRPDFHIVPSKVLAKKYKKSI